MDHDRSRRRRSQSRRRRSSSLLKTRNPAIRRCQISRRTRGSYRTRPRRNQIQYVEVPKNDVPVRQSAGLFSDNEVDVNLTESMLYETPQRSRQQRRYSSNREPFRTPPRESRRRRSRSRSRSRSQTPRRSSIGERIAERSPTPRLRGRYNSDSDEFEEEQVPQRQLQDIPHPGNVRYENGQMLDENDNVFNYDALVNTRLALQRQMDLERTRRWENDSDYKDSPRQYRRRH